MSKRAKMIARRKRQQRQRRLITAIIIVGVVAAIAALLSRSSSNPSTDPIGELIIPEKRTFPLADGTSLGSMDAPVVIEEYSDFQCLYCRDFHQTTLSEIIDTYITTGQVRFEFRQFPILGKESNAAANASLCAAEQDRFWEFADLLYANQADVGSGAFSTNRLLAYAEVLDLDQDEFSRCVDEMRYSSIIGFEYAAANANGVKSPTTFIINSEIIHGPEPPSFADFQIAIETALQQTD